MQPMRPIQPVQPMQPILIWGAGAIGGCLGAYWTRAGVTVLMVDIVAEHVKACRDSGLAITGPVDDFVAVVPAFTPGELQQQSRQRYRCIVLAVKAHATEAALDQLLPYLADDGFVLSAQNGLNGIAIARRAGAGRTMGCFVNFGADWHGPGKILYGNRGAVVVGEIDGSIRDRTREMHRLLALFEPQAELTDNIDGYLWGKLAYGAMLFATALTPDSMAQNFADPCRMPVLEAMGCEVMAVAAARNVRPVGFGDTAGGAADDAAGDAAGALAGGLAAGAGGTAHSSGDGFDPRAFLPLGSAAAKRRNLAWLADYTAHSAKTHSGIWRDLAVRKRKTEVDAQIGVIVSLGQAAGIATPTLARLVTLIHDIEDGRRIQSRETFKCLTQ